jgi:two-component system LytT family response regulator
MDDVLQHMRDWAGQLPGSAPGERGHAMPLIVGDDPRRLWRVLVADDDQPARTRVAELMQRELDFQLVAACPDGLDAVRRIEELQPDLVLLDVQMPEISGLEVVHAIGADQMPFVIFVTSYDQFAVAAFEANAVDYIMKPYDNRRFALAIERVRQRLEQNHRPVLPEGLRTTPGYPSRLVVKHAGVNEVLRADSIDWLEPADNYVRLHVGGGIRLVRGTLASLAARLDPAIFLRIHRSTIVNMQRIKAISQHNYTDFSLTLLDGTRLSSSRAYRDDVRAFMQSLKP